MTVLDTGGNPIFFDKIFLRSPDQALMTLKKILSKYPIDIIVVGNGTGVNETVVLLQSITKIDIFIVNES
jgi:transcriptional accessory protein Tex/SPT6